MIKKGDPFEFVAASYLVEIRKERARNLFELLMHLRTVPEESVFFHTFQSLEAHHYTSFSNDFAQWASSECNDIVLGERLGAIDLTEMATLEQVRQAFLGVLERQLDEDPDAGARHASDPFYFCTSSSVTAPLELRAHDVKGLAEGIRCISRQTLHHHFIASRLRPKLLMNDFSNWLEEGLGLSQLAAHVNRVDFFTNTLEGVRAEILRLLAPYSTA